MRTTTLAVGILLLATAVGCAGNQQQASVDATGSYAAPASIYSVMDPTSLVYTDVAAGAAANDNPWRWAGFLLHPVGVGIDYGLNRPIYTLSSQTPYLFGYTSEDSMKDSQRR
jgi:long-subunit fatty acid transport protein